MTVVNRKYLILSIIIVFSGLLLSIIYRPYIYANNINDFGIADTIGSFVAVLGFCFFVWGIKEYSNKEKNKQIIIATFIYSFGWELFGYLGIYGTYDKKDIIAALISGLITFLIKEIIDRKNQKLNKKNTTA